MSALAPIQTAPTITNNTALGTTPAKIPSASDPAKVRRFKITNLSSSAIVAYTFVAISGTEPTSSTLTASASGSGASTDGSVIFPQTSEFIPVRGGLDLWVVASAASTPMQVTEFDHNDD